MSGVSQLVIVAGPNGAGKTSFIKNYLPIASRSYEFLNADEIARKRSDAPVPTAAENIWAAREMLRRLSMVVELRQDVLFETTLASRTIALKIPGWQRTGYQIILYYLMLSSPETAIERVKRRVVAGGHGIPEHDIRRRFGRSLKNLEACKSLVNEWYVFDSLEGEFRLHSVGASDD